MANLVPEFRIAVVHANGGTTLDIAGELDLATAVDFGARLEAVIDASASDVTIDLSQVTFLDSTGLRVLVAAQRRLRVENRQLTVRNPSGMVSRLFEVSGVGGALNLEGPAAATAAD
ncbi:MAG: STAS domain-containing protein [Ilumatobacteraceae bacterium]